MIKHKRPHNCVNQNQKFNSLSYDFQNNTAKKPKIIFKVNKAIKSTAGKEFNLTDEQIDFIKLIYAREFYKQGEIEKGDYYLKSVEESSGKTSDVTRLCLEARTNKRFFQYRDNNVPKYLSLVKTSKRKKLK